MSKGIGKRVALSVTAVFIAVAAVIAVGAIGTEPASAGWCVTTDASGNTTFESGFSFLGGPKRCDDKDGQWISNGTKKRIDNPPNIPLLNEPPTTCVDDFPPGWFGSLDVCLQLPSNQGAHNRIEEVYVLRASELGAQIAYDIGSNELTGILGAILGVVLGSVKPSVFVSEWTYDVQDECQEIVERNTIQSIYVDTQGLVTNVQTILARVDVAVSTRATQSSVDAVDAKVMQISTALGTLATSLTTETDEIDAALAALSLQLAAGLDQSLQLYIEDHLESCRAIASLLLADAQGLLPLTVAVVDDLATRAEAGGSDIGNARQHMANADSAIAAGDAAKGFQSLCTAYGKIVNAP